MTDKYLVFDSHPFTYEGVTRDFASGTNPCSPLDFDERSYAAVIPDFAAI
jgi:hypothetical protein